ncbi:MAG: hypothetical protein LUC37_03005 [Prevotella sp.]|nr:hypothetical protein [Prevotella sp.]
MTKSMNSSKKATKEMASSYSVSDISNKQISNALDFAMVGLGQWLQPGQIVQSMIASLSAAVQQVKALDSSFASIAMVTNYSMKEMWGTYDQYSSMAVELGQSIQSVVDASALYYQ